MLGSIAAAAEPSAIPWREDFQQAQAEARTRNRPLWIQFTGPWCHFCTRLEQETLIHPRVIGHARNSFVPIKLRSDIHEELALRYGLTGLPATIIVKPTGEVVMKHEGFLDADQFQELLNDSLARVGPLRPTPPPPPPPSAVALAGYCPVSLVVDRKLVVGQAGISARYEGREYRFATETGRALFQKYPERFIPVNGARCPVNQVDSGDPRPGDPHWGVLYQGHLFLCADESSRKHFLDQPERYSHVDVADRGFCPHCWVRDSLVVRGKPQSSLIRNDHRFFFPDSEHREAFRTSTETTRRLSQGRSSSRATDNIGWGDMISARRKSLPSPRFRPIPSRKTVLAFHLGSDYPDPVAVSPS